jgi:DNA-binding response OmpR family regulator
VEAKAVKTGRKVVVLETDPQLTQQLREAAEDPGCPLVVRVVRDRLSLQLVLKRQRPDVVVIALDSDAGQQVAHELAQHDDERVWVGIVSHEGQAAPLRDRLSVQLRRPYSAQELFQAIETAWTRRHEPACANV